MAGDVDDVVGARHDRDIAVLVDHPGVAGLVVAGEGREIAADEAALGVPQRRQRARRQRQPDRHRAELARRQRLAGLRQDPHVVARHRHRRRAELDRQQLDPRRVRRDRPAGLGLPPVVDHRHLELPLQPRRWCRGRPARRRGTGSAGRTGRSPSSSRPCRVLALDRTEGGRRGEEAPDPVLLDHPPEGAGVGGADRLALEDDGRRPDRAAARSRCRSGRRPSRRRRRPRRPRPGSTA